MKIALIGSNGKMGKAVSEVIKDGDEIVAKIDSENVLKKSVTADVIIDFSTAENRQEYINFSFKKKVPYCCFATAISTEDMKEFHTLAKRVPVLVSSNASLGANFLFEMVELASQKLPNSEVVILEYHHKNKKDSPSGTAKKIREIFGQNNKMVDVRSFRVGNECGTHILQLFLEDEIIELKHQAKSRKVFAIGAIEMARSLCKRKRGFYEK